MTINIPSAVFDVYEEGVDWMITNLGINCRIVYPPIKIECPNCYNTSLPGVGATNIYNDTGPYPFTGGVCPYCSGVGYKEESTSESIKVRCYFDKKSWNKLIPNLGFRDGQQINNLGIKNGDAMIIGYMKDIPKFQNMKYIELASDFEGFAVRPHTLSTDLIPWGIKKRRYFYCFVERT